MNANVEILAPLALCLVGCGGGGGGGGGASVVSAQFASSISESVETGSSTSIEIELSVPWGTLLEAVEFYVSDLGSGSAEAGVDYIPLGALTLIFPIGAQDGDRLSVTWTPLDDGLMEGNESLVLGLMPIGDSSVLGRSQITATILDDESSTLLVEQSSRGGPLLSHQQGLHLGNQTIGIPTQTGIDVWLDNVGISPLRISAPMLVAGDPAEFVIETPVQIGASLTAESAPVDVLSPLFNFGAATGSQASSIPLYLSSELLEQLEPHSKILLRGMPIPGDLPVDLELTRVPSPISADAVLSIDGEQVQGGLISLAAEISTWSGHIVGDPEARVFLALSESGSRGWIRPGNELSDPLHLQAAANSSEPAILIRNSALVNATLPGQPDLCAGVREVPGREQGMISSAATTDGGSHVPYVCRLALETDYQLYAKFGDPGLLIDYVTELVAAVSDRFHNDVATTLQIVYLGIHTTPSDPWTSQDSGGTVEDLLLEFQQAWAPAFGNSWPASADIAHLLSGALGGGMSFINVLCDQDHAFGVSTGLTASTDWSSYGGGTSTLYWDFDVLAHEIGHAFNARHTHEYCPPLDTCALSCQGQVCESGTIMSYCHACPGGVANVDLRFHPRIANEMRLAANNSCLSEDTLASGDATFFRLFFRPQGVPGSRIATLEFTHDASSAPSPYRITLTGDAE